MFQGSEDSSRPQAGLVPRILPLMVAATDLESSGSFKNNPSHMSVVNPTFPKKLIFITGISSGIGKATAEKFLDMGHFVIGTLRTEKEIASYPCASANKSQLKLIPLNLKDLNQVRNLSEKLRLAILELGFQKMDIVIQNAGMAMAAPYIDQDFSEVEDIITVNVLALMQIAQLVVPLTKQSGGRFIHMSSVSGQNGTPFLAAYCASKHAVEGFSESLRRELNLLGIKVIVIGPGSIQTPIWKKGFEQIRSKYNSSVYATSFSKFINFASNEEKNGLPVSAVVADIIHAATSASPFFRYAPVPRKFQNYYLAKLFPRSFMDRIIIRVLGLS